jgi:hypothetical protein
VAIFIEVTLVSLCDITNGERVGVYDRPFGQPIPHDPIVFLERFP